MLFMVTNRRFQNGKYGDEEQPRFKFDYLYDYMNGPQGNDGFNKKGKRGFEAALFTEAVCFISPGPLCGEAATVSGFRKKPVA